LWQFLPDGISAQYVFDLCWRVRCSSAQTMWCLLPLCITPRSRKPAVPRLCHRQQWAQQFKTLESPTKRGRLSMGFGWGRTGASVFYENNVTTTRPSMLKTSTSTETALSGRNCQIQLRLSDIKRDGGVSAGWRKLPTIRRKSLQRRHNETGCDKTRALDAVSWTIALLGQKTAGYGHWTRFTWWITPSVFPCHQRREGERVEGFDFTDTEEDNTQAHMGGRHGPSHGRLPVMSRYAKSIGRKDKPKNTGLKR